jgi:hypoxanthine-DNA glycosylase
MSEIHCFPPIESADAEILILGSAPSERSLLENQYYGHPSNAFWFIMGELLGFDPRADYEERKRILVENRIALWDVMRSCERSGSLDSAIKTQSVKPNDFSSFLQGHSKIKRVFFNGAKAEAEYKRLVLPLVSKDFPKLEYNRLPSTSPAMASLSRAAKLASWKKIRETI